MLSRSRIRITHRLAVARRQDADAQVEVLAADGDLDPAVLGPALLGDVDRAHDLDAATHRAPAAGAAGCRARPARRRSGSGCGRGRRTARCGCRRPAADRLLDDQVAPAARPGRLPRRPRRRRAAASSAVSVKSMAVSVNSCEHRVDRLGLRRSAVVPVDRLDDRLLGRQGRPRSRGSG